MINMDKHAKRKSQPVFTIISKYFPRATKCIAEVSVAGNKQHHENKPLYWDKSKSVDELDAGFRHGMEAGTVDDDTMLHAGKHAWRAMAYLERELEYREDHNTPDTEDVNYQDVISYTKEKHTKNPLGLCELCTKEAVTKKGDFGYCYNHYENY